MATHTQTQPKHSHTNRAVIVGSVLITAAIVFLAFMLRPNGSYNSTPPAVAKQATPRIQIIQPTTVPQPTAQPDPTPIFPGTTTVREFEGRSVDVKALAPFTVGASWSTAFSYNCVNTRKNTVHFWFEVVDSTGDTVYRDMPNEFDNPSSDWIALPVNKYTMQISSPEGGTYHFVVHSLLNCQWKIAAIQ